MRRPARAWPSWRPGHNAPLRTRPPDAGRVLLVDTGPDPVVPAAACSALADAVAAIVRAAVAVAAGGRCWGWCQRRRERRERRPHRLSLRPQPPKPPAPWTPDAPTVARSCDGPTRQSCQTRRAHAHGANTPAHTGQINSPARSRRSTTARSASTVNAGASARQATLSGSGVQTRPGRTAPQPDILTVPSQTKTDNPHKSCPSHPHRQRPNRPTISSS
jgi:hypothetical protein